MEQRYLLAFAFLLTHVLMKESEEKTFLEESSWKWVLGKAFFQEEFPRFHYQYIAQ